MERQPEKLANPYLTGVLLGLVLLSSFTLLGAGLGASGGMARLSAWMEGLIAPGHTLASPYFGRWGQEPLSYYLVFMLAGIFLGACVSALASNRFKLGAEKGASFPTNLRLLYSLIGGVLIGFASRLAAGCTSGQALTGGALLLSGSLVFLLSLFATGYALARLFRRQWND
ncbi:MAG: YeeE/YedE family protein [Proteobacteria bacterium]|nr:YeeE/YedE family protein [Pseudomonadota bacterium]MBU1449377.1 YeeE/YedE family protein [Pseudomonadota bacterium]MBU2518311.1 YeeE/YedE family protein [Pseudomonadota bacterium]